VQTVSDKKSKDWHLVSMTGFGRGQAIDNEVAIDVVIRSVNSRGLEIKYRLPDELSFMEGHCKKAISDSVERGRVDVQMSLTPLSSACANLVIDVARAQAIITEALRLNDQFQEVLPLTMGDVLGIPGIIKQTQPSLNEEQLTKAAHDALKVALAELLRHREQEGEGLKPVLCQMFFTSTELIAAIALAKDTDTSSRFIRYKARVDELFGSYDISHDRLWQEVALLAERSDFTEEIDRLKAHAEYFAAQCAIGHSKGRRLDFICQEMLRESNTLMSKAFDSAITIKAIELKAEIERIREHVQNIE